ncbi:MAG: 30S ribosome-binding factor RbfA [Acidimicrobiia bacterium]
MSRGRAPRKYPRTARVNEVVREVLAEELERLSDPRLGFITLTDVEVSRDLRHATVYYSALGKKGAPQSEEEVDATAAALVSSTRHLRSVLSREVRLKYLPELHFRVDPSVAQAQRVEQILRELRDGERPSGLDGDEEEAT